jgi:hypothetical protein
MDRGYLEAEIRDRMRRVNAIFRRSLLPRVRVAAVTTSLLLLVAACATVNEQTDWIRIGVTTRDEVVARYGQPDLVITAPEGDTVTYRPTGRMPPPAIEVPTIQPGGSLGLPTTKMEKIPSGPDTPPHVRPARTIHIRYSAKGVVQDVTSEP